MKKIGAVFAVNVNADVSSATLLHLMDHSTIRSIEKGKVYLPNDRFLLEITHELLIGYRLLLEGQSIESRLHMLLLIIIFVIVILVPVLMGVVYRCLVLIVVAIFPAATTSFAFHNNLN